MRTFKPLWHEGLILTPQHFQQQERWLNVAQRQFASLAIAEPWGIIEVELDEDALAAGRLSLSRLKLRLTDGTLIDSSAMDVLSCPRDLTRDLPSDVQSVTILAALPLLNADGSNCRFDDETPSRPRRYFREFVEVPDLNGTGVEERSVERHAVHLLFDFEPHADHVVCPIARLVRGVRGQFEVDRAFVPPCLTLAAHERHQERIARLSDILLAKSTALAARRSERVDQIAEFGVADVSLFGLLHCIHTHWPKLAFLGTHPNQPPERLYDVLATLAGALMTFSTGTSLAAIPPYEHAKQEEIFSALEALIRDLLDAIIPSRVIPIGLTHKSATLWAGQFKDEWLLEGADYYLSVYAALPAFQLIEQIPKLCKIGSPDDIEHIVNSALAGIPLKAVQRVPAAIPVRLENQYFALDASDPAHARMLAARACQLYLPPSVPEASLELYAVLTS
ncbi:MULTISPECIES: type VI secretion system baseplate subunit TssK [unclassified Caballeronia]|uniref:type VI secretion system baseplate subunit TssK n=1 Tax=unclassified Caballeronia TaxID=2646786 RepID=UPI00286370A6|nr:MULTISPECIES: type VI secretion system baseplate subunit TssK [unclassified Caballeronia]MDR5753441.1 type VI secretion system baseplate subunit TssK [Caballeronia sp. LZ024]MDR5841179.1 type VI secretion system baseplate subunit TssK [Caballeronia sp. LZ031]